MEAAPTAARQCQTAWTKGVFGNISSTAKTVMPAALDAACTAKGRRRWGRRMARQRKAISIPMVFPTLSLKGSNGTAAKHGAVSRSRGVACGWRFCCSGLDSTAAAYADRHLGSRTPRRGRAERAGTRHASGTWL